MKKPAPLIPLPAFAQRGFRTAYATSKHAGGRAPKKVNGQHEAGKQGSGASGNGAKKQAAKTAFLAASSQEASRLANEKSMARLYREWRGSMTAEERAGARRLKCLQPLADDGAPRARCGQEVDLDFHDPADLPEAADHRTPIDDLEPQSPFSVAIENLDDSEITAAAECFAAGLTYVLDVPDQRDLVLIGRGALAMIAVLRPDLHGAGVPPILREAFKLRVPGSPEQYAGTGEIFGRVLEWVRRGTSVSEIGERLCLVAYVVRPTMMGSPTLHQLGEVMNKTRQAKDKLASCLRDTFAGIRAMAQRGEATRDRCIAAH